MINLLFISVIHGLLVGAFWQRFWLPYGCWTILLAIYNCFFMSLNFAEFCIVISIGAYSILLGAALFKRLWYKGYFIRIGGYNSLSIKTFILLCVLFVIHAGFLLYATFPLATALHAVLVFVALLGGWAAMRDECICICDKMIRFGPSLTRMFLHLFVVLIILYLSQLLILLQTWLPLLTVFWVQVIALALATVYVVICLIWMSVPKDHCKPKCKTKKKNNCEDPCLEDDYC